MRAEIAVAIVATLLGGCRADPPRLDHPARIVTPTGESRAELRRVVSAALNGADVTLADDVLTQSSLLTIEPRAFRSIANDRIMGRDQGEPVQFRLYLQDGVCVLESSATGQRWPLVATLCVAE